MDKLFGTDGIRGVAGNWPLVPDLVLRIGQAFGTLLRRDQRSAAVVVGRDTRDSGPAVQSSLVSGLLASGIDVLDVGIIPTPGVAVLTRHLHAAAGAVISASHNPADQNGIKFLTQSGQKLSAEIELAIEELAAEPSPDLNTESSGHERRWGQLHYRDEVNRYMQELLSEHPDSFLRGITIVLDCANGAAFKVAPEVFKAAGATIHAVHCDPDGSNINVRCGSEYVRREPKEIGELIRQHHAKFGVAFDGDADRVVFVDEHAGLVDGDHMLGVLARHLHDRRALLAETVVTTTMRNTGLKHYIEAAGIKLEETPVGDKYVIERLVDLRRQFPATGMLGLGGEQAGHLVLLDDNHFTGDGIRTALHFARVFQEAKEKSLSDFAARVGKTPQIIASAVVGDLPRLSNTDLADMEKATFVEMPGLTRVNLRYSGTEPLFRVMLESDNRDSDAALEALNDVAVRLCRRVQSKAEMKPGTIEILNCTSGGVTVV